jgi:hypothetical protein
MPIDGLEKLLRKLDAKPVEIEKAAFVGMKYALTETVNYGKEAYSRPKTGKGFSDRTTNLRNSWKSTVMLKPNSVVGYVHAGWGSSDKPHYAFWVETRWDGKYAYLYPSVNDKREYIFDTIKTVCQRNFKH